MNIILKHKDVTYSPQFEVYTSLHKLKSFLANAMEIESQLIQLTYIQNQNQEIIIRSEEEFQIFQKLCSQFQDQTIVLQIKIIDAFQNQKIPSLYFMEQKFDQKSQNDEGNKLIRPSSRKLSYMRNSQQNTKNKQQKNSKISVKNEKTLTIESLQNQKNQIDFSNFTLIPCYNCNTNSLKRNYDSFQCDKCEGIGTLPIKPKYLLIINNILDYKLKTKYKELMSLNNLVGNLKNEQNLLAQSIPDQVIKEENSSFDFYGQQTCSVCRTFPVKDIVYQCSVCKVLILCQNCEQRVSHDHYLIKIRLQNNDRNSMSHQSEILNQDFQQEKPNLQTQFLVQNEVSPQGGNFEQDDVYQSQRIYEINKNQLFNSFNLHSKTPYPLDYKLLASGCSNENMMTQSQIQYTYKAKYIEKDSITNFELYPGFSFNSIIHLENQGQVQWPLSISLFCVQGFFQGCFENIKPLKAKEREQVNIPLQAPQDNGTYHNIWRIQYKYNDQTKYFGPRITIIIKVSESSQVIQEELSNDQFNLAKKLANATQIDVQAVSEQLEQNKELERMSNEEQINFLLRKFQK